MRPAILESTKQDLCAILDQQGVFDELLSQLGIDNGLVIIGLQVFGIVDVDSGVIGTYDPYLGTYTKCGVGWGKAGGLIDPSVFNGN